MKKTKSPKAIPNNKKKPLSDALISKLEEDFDFGNGLEITLGSGNSKTGDNDVTYHYSNKMDKLEIKGGQINVAVSSAEVDNEELLHFLLKKSRE